MSQPFGIASVGYLDRRGDVPTVNTVRLIRGMRLTKNTGLTRNTVRLPMSTVRLPRHRDSPGTRCVLSVRGAAHGWWGAERVCTGQHVVCI